MPTAIPRFRSNIPLRAFASALVRTLFGRHGHGAATAEFERRFAKTIGARHAITLSSVRYGVFLSLKNIGLPAGTEVLCTPLTYYPVIEAVILAGHVPVFVDVDSDNCGLDLRDAAAKLTPKSGAILATHLWGGATNIDDLLRFADERDLVLLEDASLCLNSRFHDRKLGTFGKAGFYSFSVTKPINTFHGGAVVTNDDALAEALRSELGGAPLPGRLDLMAWILAELALYLATNPLIFSIAGRFLGILRNLGYPDKLDHRRLPRSARLSEFPRSLLAAFCDVQAQAGLQMLESIDADDARRGMIARIYSEAFAGHPSLLRRTNSPADSERHCTGFPIRCTHPDVLKDELWSRQRIDTTLPSLDACHEMPYFGEYQTPLPHASQVIRETLFLPLYPKLTPDEARRIAASVLQSFSTVA